MKNSFYALCLSILALPAYSQVNLQEGLLAQYTLNGTPADAGSGNHHLSASGGPSATTDRFGASQGAYQLFSSTPDYFSGAFAAELNPGEITVAAWVKLSDPENDQKIAGKAAVNQGGYLMGVQLHKLDAEIWDITGGHLRVQGGNVPTNTWTHIAISYKSSQYLRLFVNGEQVDSLAASVYPLGSTSNSFTLGGAPWQPEALNMDGGLDDVYLYNRVLSRAEVKALFELVTDRKEDLSPGKLSVYPIPVSDGRLYVELEYPGAAVSIHDAMGKEVFRSDLQNEKQQLNVSYLARGIYQLKIAQGNTFDTRTIVVN